MKKSSGDEMRKFEWVEHPSDIGFRAFGRDLTEAFENAGLALFEVMTDTEKVERKEEVSIEISAEDEGALLYDWLDKLISIHDSKNLLLSKFDLKITEKDEVFMLKGKAWGEKFDPSRHKSKTSVKAMTYHMMEIKRGHAGCWVQAVVDI